MAWGLEGVGSVGWGSTPGEAREALAGLGQPVVEVIECLPVMTILRWDALSLTFAGDAGLQGYTVTSADLPSVWGFGIGSTVEDALAADPAVQVEEASISRTGSRWQLDPPDGGLIWGETTGTQEGDLLTGEVHASGPPPVTFGCAE